jgi:hypothetical protein
MESEKREQETCETSHEKGYQGHFGNTEFLEKMTSHVKCFRD